MPEMKHISCTVDVGGKMIDNVRVQVVSTAIGEPRPEEIKKAVEAMFPGQKVSGMFRNVKLL